MDVVKLALLLEYYSNEFCRTTATKASKAYALARAGTMMSHCAWKIQSVVIDMVELYRTGQENDASLARKLPGSRKAHVLK